MNQSAEENEAHGAPFLPDPLNGPHGWLNLQAARAGLPARSSSGEGVLPRPLWTEFALYSDARMTGTLPSGPLDVMLAFPSGEVRMGVARPELLLRVTDHLLEGSPDARVPERQETEAYVGGDIADEVASLLSLALGRRIRSGGSVRLCWSPEAPLGRPHFQAVTPQLEPPQYAPMLPGIADEVRIDQAGPYLDHYMRLAAPDAVAVLRAAHQFADAIWWADTDPRIAWIKLFGAVEAAAARWDEQVIPAPVEQLRRRHPHLHGKLSKHVPDALPIVADSISRMIGAENKLVEFVLAHEPGPPERRPEDHAQVDWERLRDVLHILYDHRSRDLHGGIPFPAPLCQAPIRFGDVPPERFIALAMSVGGTTWPASALPMYLHVFANLVARTLRTWWLSLPYGDAFDGINVP